MGKELSPEDLKAQRQARLAYVDNSRSELRKKIFDNGQYDNYLEAANAHFKSTNRLIMAEQVFSEDNLAHLYSRLDHHAVPGNGAVYLVELEADPSNYHPAQDEMRVYIALGVFDRTFTPDTPWEMRVQNRYYPDNVSVSLIMTDFDGRIASDAILTGFRSFDRGAIYDRYDGKPREHNHHHSIMTGIVNYNRQVIFNVYNKIREYGEAAILLLAKRQIAQQDPELGAVWLLAGLRMGVNWKLENHIVLKEAMDAIIAEECDHADHV